MAEESVVLIESVRKALVDLGQSADDVAASLRVAGVQGVRNAARYLNPVVRWVLGRTQTKPFAVDVMQGDRLSVSLAEGGRFEVAIPPVVLQFLAAFDQGAYPELELPPGALAITPPQE